MDSKTSLGGSIGFLSDDHPFNVYQLLYHHQESERKSIVIAELEKDQIFR